MPKIKIDYADLRNQEKHISSCKAAGKKGKIIVGLTVNKEGKPVNIHIIKGIGNGCDKAAIQAIKRYTQFTPGILNGRPVKVGMTYSVVFNKYFSGKRLPAIVNKSPELKMGYDNFKKNVRYPAKCRIAGIDGKVVVGFVVNKKGMPVNIHIVKGIGGGCDEAVIQAVKRYARYTPAMLNGEPVPMARTIHILFKLKRVF